MSTPVVLLTARLGPPSVMAALEGGYRVHRLDLDQGIDALPAAVREAATALVTTGGDGAPGPVIDALPALEIIACYGVGVDRIDLDTAARRGVAVTHTPDVLTGDVADLALTLWTALGRDLLRADRWVRESRWAQEGSPGLAGRLGARTVGFLGFGRIGQAIARRLQPIGPPILYHKRTPLADDSFEYVASLDALARRSDDLIVCCEGGARTRHLVDADVIAALGRGGRVINIARGSVVDEAALTAALREGRLAGAALDVFEDEPWVPAELRALDNVVLTPHVGSATVETRQAMGDLVLANLAAHYRGDPLLTPVV